MNRSDGWMGGQRSASESQATDVSPRASDEPLDLLVIGAGLGGVVALYYARKAGLTAVALDRQDVVGGLWAMLPPWQDIQFGRNDWTLGDLPISGEDQASIRDNIQAWVDRFELAGAIHLRTEVTKAGRVDGLWEVRTQGRTYRSKHLLCATGAHNRPFVPAPQRDSVTLHELHSSQLRDPNSLRGQHVVVVGGGASAYDLLDLCFAHEAAGVTWVYRHPRWMMPTLKPKSIAGSPRGLARAQMEGADVEQISRDLRTELASRYAKFGLQDIWPKDEFNLGRDQLIPGRHRMIENFARIERHRAEVVGLQGRSVTLSTGQALEADLLLWGTGYEVDLSFFANEALSRIRRHDELFAQCGSGMRSIAEPSLYFMAAGLESTGTAPWAYALLARTLMSHLLGQARIDLAPLPHKLNHFHYAAFLAERDPLNFPEGSWESEYVQLATTHPPDQPLPIPGWKGQTSPATEGSIKVRAAMEQDLQALQACIDAAFSPYIARMGMAPAPMLADHAALVAQKRAWMGESDGQGVGVLVAYETEDGFYVDTVAVPPARQRSGVGRALLDFAEREARSRGFGSLYLCTNSKMVENLAMYPRLGYVEYDRRNQDGYDRVFFRKTI